jgi:hypothetical protein
MKRENPIIYKSHEEPWTSEEIEHELAWFAEALAVQNRGYEGWRKLEERAQLNADLRAASDEQWARFFRICATIRAKLNEFGSAHPR